MPDDASQSGRDLPGPRGPGRRDLPGPRGSGRRASESGRRGGGRSIRPSPLFLAICAVTIAAGAAAWNLDDGTGLRFAVFVMVLGGWVVSLCLHEFAHAYIAYRHGDLGVEARGYLTLDPLRYTHPFLSLVLPVVFIALGGIGLPGGAVYLQTAQMPPKVRRRIALAGPAVNAVLAIMLLVAVRLLWANAAGGQPNAVVYGLAFLAFLQIMAAVLNLLPVPGLDGYAALEPHLSASTRRSFAQFAPFGIIAVFALLTIPALNAAFFRLIYAIFEVSGVPGGFSTVGFVLFRFWA